MSQEHGSLSINSENIFPIIKKWLYSDHDIFFRELVSNGSDAITKLKKLELIGEAVLPEDNEYKIQIRVNPDEKTIKFIDNGIGMTREDVIQNIGSIAKSGTKAFLEKLQKEKNKKIDSSNKDESIMVPP